jgi:RNA polymerase sigma factor (sigma-70 family)
MQPRRRERAADFSTYSDDQLALLARQPDGDPGFLALAMRLWPWMTARVGRLCRRHGLSRESARDLRQEAFLLLRDVVAEYDPNRGGRRRQFRSFLSGRLSGLVQHGMRARQRDQRRLQMVGAVEFLEHQAAVAAGHGSTHAGPLDGAGGDPALIAERRELDERVRRELGRLPPQLRSVLVGVSRHSLYRMARHWGLSPRTLQLWKQKGLATLRDRLRHWMMA